MHPSTRDALSHAPPGTKLPALAPIPAPEAHLKQHIFLGDQLFRPRKQATAMKTPSKTPVPPYKLDNFLRLTPSKMDNFSTPSRNAVDNFFRANEQLPVITPDHLSHACKAGPQTSPRPRGEDRDAEREARHLGGDNRIRVRAILNERLLRNRDFELWITQFKQ